MAFDPAGNALAVWQRFNGTNTIVQAAPYDATGPVLRSVVVPATGFARQRLTFSVDPFDIWSPLAGPPVWNFGDGKSASGGIDERLSLIDAMRDHVEASRFRSAVLRRSILERAFRGELVPQDPSDEPASVLLGRIAAERAAAEPKPRRRSRNCVTAQDAG